MRFKKGQQIVCISPGDWRYSDGSKAPGPKRNEIVTVYGYDLPNSVLLYEYMEDGEGYNEIRFEPLMDISELTEILNHEPQHV